ncbi:MAG: SDR family oxidoreductase [Spirochaetales bacterium]|nr:SDR family oxidoreductase [Spirochaetales bacterium]
MSDTILITGAARGIGFALAKLFLENGFTVFALSATLRDELTALAGTRPDRLLLFRCDVTNEDEIAAAAAGVARYTPMLDVLVNNAAVLIENRAWDLDKVDFEAMKKTYDVNSVAPLRVIKHFIGPLLRGKRKLLVNVTSEAGSIGDAWRKSEFGYCMSKAALNMASAILQNRYRDGGVKVLALHPGWVRTDMGGPEAPIPPEDSAAKLFALIRRKWRAEDPIYFDLDGKPMQW